MKAIGDHPRQSRSRRISAFSGAWTPAPSLYTDVHKKLHKKWRAFVISLCITVILAPVSADRCMMFLPRRYDGCRPASLPTTSPLHAAMRQGARVRADRLPVVYGTATSSESSYRSGSPAPAPPSVDRQSAYHVYHVHHVTTQQPNPPLVPSTVPDVPSPST